MRESFKLNLGDWKCTILLLAGCILISLWASGCSHKTTTFDTKQNVFRLNLGTEPPTLDPMQMTDLTSFTVVQNTQRGLTEFRDGPNVYPAAAERWEHSADGLTYTFHLRKNARWSDGKPLTAHDFVYAWQRALTPENGADYAFFLYELKNGKAFYEGKLKDFSKVGAIALDDHTLRVTLERPVAFILGLLASPIALPVRQDLVEKYGEDFTEASHYVANGPYVMTTWVHDDRIVLKPNPYYYGDKPGVDAVEMLMVNDTNTSGVMYENNELDFIETTTSISAFDYRRLKNHPDAHRLVIHRINYFGYNLDKPPFNDVRVRQAFSLALDRSYYPRLLQSGQRPLASWISEGLIGYNPKVGLQYNPERARQLLAEAGYPDGKGFPTVTLAYRTMYDIQKECEIAQFLWKKNLGVDVKLENMEWKVFLNRLKDDVPNIYRMGWYVDYPDADSYMTVFISDSGNNYSKWKNPQYDKLVAEAAITLDVKKRQQLYDAAQKLLLETDASITPEYAAEKLYLVKPWVKSLGINELNLIDLSRVSIQPH